MRSRVTHRDDFDPDKAHARVDLTAGESMAVPPTLTLRGQLIGRDLPEEVWNHPCFRARSRYLEIFCCHPHSWCPETRMCTDCGVSEELAAKVWEFTPERE